MIRYGKADIDSGYSEVLRQAISEYADSIFSLLRKYEYDPKMMRLYITGSGGKLIENFGTYERDRVTIIGDICASAKGYEEFALVQLKKEGRSLWTITTITLRNSLSRIWLSAKTGAASITA